MSDTMRLVAREVKPVRGKSTGPATTERLCRQAMSVDTVLSVLVLACLALVLGAVALWRRGGQSKQVWLMLLLAAIVAANVAIWVVPGKAGKTLAQQDQR